MLRSLTSRMTRLIAIYIILIHHSLFSQSSENHFIELNYSGMYYKSMLGDAQPWNSGFGLVVNRQIGSLMSFEIAYENSWLQEKYHSHSFQAVAHYVSIRLGATKEIGSHSLSGLLGADLCKTRFGVVLGLRYTAPLSAKWSVNTSAFASLAKKSYPDTSNDWSEYYPYLYSRVLVLAQLGIAYHFSYR